MMVCPRQAAALTVAEICRGVLAVTVGHEDGYALEEMVAYSDGTVVVPIYFRGMFASVEIRKDGKEIGYERTNRPIGEYDIPDQIKRQLLNGSAAGLRVLDVGMGGGRAVLDMRHRGVLAEGLDIIVDRHQKGKPYFHQAQMADMPFAEGRFDIVMSNQSFFTYGARLRRGEPDFQRGVTTLLELSRVTRVGGKIVLGTCNLRDAEALVEAIPELKLSDFRLEGNRKWVVLERTK